MLSPNIILTSLKVAPSSFVADVCFNLRIRGFLSSNDLMFESHSLHINIWLPDIGCVAHTIKRQKKVFHLYYKHTCGHAPIHTHTHNETEKHRNLKQNEKE